MSYPLRHRYVGYSMDISLKTLPRKIFPLVFTELLAQFHKPSGPTACFGKHTASKFHKVAHVIKQWHRIYHLRACFQDP
jgi:hypothetical protein